MRYDVLVAGGGGAGLAAAITAARAGAHTLLVERNGSLGGMATAALVHTICGLYLLREEPEAVLAHSGFPSEFAARLIAHGAASGPVRMGRVDVLPHSPTGFAAVAASLLADCPNLEVRLDTEIREAANEDGIVVELRHHETCERIQASAAVDASGDAALAERLGLATDQAPSSQLQRAAFIFTLQGTDLEHLCGDGKLRLAHRIAAAVRDNELDPGALGAHFRVSSCGSDVLVTIDLAGEPDFDPTNPNQLDELERQGRQLAVDLTGFLSRAHPGFCQAKISALPARVGVRESRRVRGLATVTQEDVLRGTSCEDSVALGTWPIELRERHTGPKWRFPDANRPTHIPLRALKPRGATNLWVAGRCISCDHEAQASLRVIGTCMATGQAAGAAAALQAQDGLYPEADAVRTLLHTVHSAELPNVA